MLLIFMGVMTLAFLIYLFIPAPKDKPEPKKPIKKPVKTGTTNRHKPIEKRPGHKRTG